MTKQAKRRAPVAGTVWHPPPGGVLDLTKVKPAPPVSAAERARAATVAEWPVTVMGTCAECGAVMGMHTHGPRCSWWDVNPDLTPF